MLADINCPRCEAGLRVTFDQVINSETILCNFCMFQIQLEDQDGRLAGLRDSLRERVGEKDALAEIIFNLSDRVARLERRLSETQTELENQRKTQGAIAATPAEPAATATAAPADPAQK